MFSIQAQRAQEIDLAAVTAGGHALTCDCGLIGACIEDCLNELSGTQISNVKTAVSVHAILLMQLSSQV